jgi:hypothetical protein
LETGSLTVELTPLRACHPEATRFWSPKDLGARLTRSLFHFFMRRMLAATTAEFLELQPLSRRLPVLGRRIIALFAITALHRNDFSGHCSLLNSNAEVKSQNAEVESNLLSLPHSYF